MRSIVRGVRSVAAVVLLGLSFVLTGTFQRLILWPLVKLFPARRTAIMSPFMFFMAQLVLAMTRLGGGRMKRNGTIPSHGGGLILMNHQSLLDIPTAVALCSPYAPLIVTRRRYGRFIPVISLMVRMQDFPQVDPAGDPRRAIATLKKAAASTDRAILLFPEGHRSRDGEVGEFETAGIRVILGRQPMPVYLVVTDGVWECRRFVDFLFKMHKIRGTTEVLGPFYAPTPRSRSDREQGGTPGFTPGVPDAHGDLPSFIGSLRETLVARLREIRRRDASF